VQSVLEATESLDTSDGRGSAGVHHTAFPAEVHSNCRQTAINNMGAVALVVKRRTTSTSVGMLWILNRAAIPHQRFDFSLNRFGGGKTGDWGSSVADLDY
jgi:hypothetical protein